MSEPKQKPLLPYYCEEKRVTYQMIIQEKSGLESLIRACRLEVAGLRDHVIQIIDTGKAHTNGKSPH